LSQQVWFYFCSAYNPLTPPFQLTDAPVGIMPASSPLANKQPVALGESAPASSSIRHNGDVPAGDTFGGGGGSGGVSDEDTLQARLDALRRG
jgi:charged multivesicular body protein 2A